MIEARVLGTGSNINEVLEDSVHILKTNLATFCKRRKAQNLTQINQITAKMLGTNTDRKLKLKGAENKTVFLWIDYYLPSCVDRIADGDTLLQAVRALKTLLNGMDRCPDQPDQQTCAVQHNLLATRQNPYLVL